MNHTLPQEDGWIWIPTQQINEFTFPNLAVKHPTSIAHWRRVIIRLEVWKRAQGGKSLLEHWTEKTRRIENAKYCSHPPECQKAYANDWCQAMSCYAKLGGCGAILAYHPTAKALANRRKKAQSRRARPMIQRLDDDEEDRCPRCERVFQLSMGYGNQTILKCTGWIINKCTMIKALPHESLPCGPHRQNVSGQPTSQGGSSNSSGRTSSSAQSSSEPVPSVNLEALTALGLTPSQAQNLVAALAQGMTSQSSGVTLPLASLPIPAKTYVKNRKMPKPVAAEPLTAIPEIDLSQADDSEMIHISDDEDDGL